MKKMFSILLFVLFPSLAFAQNVVLSGAYNYGLNIAYDPDSHIISGYYENYTGWDEEANHHRFSCVFYIEGKIDSGKTSIKTDSPTFDDETIIEGTLEIVDPKNLTIQLSDEHGGCWNVEHFVTEPVAFELGAEKNWFQIRFVKADKSYFYKNTSSDKKLRSYLVKGDFVCIEKIEKDRAYYTYLGKKRAKGWIMLKDLNRL